jgi:hypothetical protein
MPQTDQDKQQPETNRWYDQEVHGGDTRRMIAKEGLPCLRGPSSTPGHVLGNSRLSDLDPELQQFTWIRGAPQSGLPRLMSRIR